MMETLSVVQLSSAYCRSLLAASCALVVEAIWSIASWSLITSHSCVRVGTYAVACEDQYGVLRVELDAAGERCADHKLLHREVAERACDGEDAWVSRATYRSRGGSRGTPPAR